MNTDIIDTIMRTPRDVETKSHKAPTINSLWPGDAYMRQ